MDAITTILKFYNIRPVFIHTTDTFLFLILPKPISKDILDQLILKTAREVLILIEGPLEHILQQYLRASRINKEDYSLVHKDNSLIVYVKNNQVKKLRGQYFKRWNFLNAFITQQYPQVKVLLKSLNQV